MSIGVAGHYMRCWECAGPTSDGDLHPVPMRILLLGGRAAEDHVRQNLIEGDAAARIAPAPNVTIRVRLTRLLKSWDRLKPVVVVSADGDEVALKEFQKASILGDLISKSLDKTAGYYWQL